MIVFWNQPIDLSPELVKFYRSAAGDPEDRVTNVRRVRRHYDFIVIGDSSRRNIFNSKMMLVGRWGLCWCCCGESALRSVRFISKQITTMFGWPLDMSIQNQDWQISWIWWSKDLEWSSGWSSWVRLASSAAGGGARWVRGLRHPRPRKLHAGRPLWLAV